MEIPPNPSISPKEALDYALKSFQYNAGQRMQAFNFFLILMGALFVGYDGASKAGSHENAAVIAAFGAIVALAFLILDVRNTELVNIGREALESIEESPAFPDSLPEKCRLFLIQKKNRSIFKSHSLWLRTIQIFLLIISVVALFSSVCKCKSKNTHPHKEVRYKCPTSNKNDEMRFSEERSRRMQENLISLLRS
jgi:hypothetical protein